MQETKCATGGNFFFKLLYVGDRSVLAAEDRGIVVNHHGYPVVIEGQRRYFYLSCTLTIKDTVLNFKKIPQSILLLCTCFFKNLNELYRTAVHNGSLRPINLHHHVINLQTYEGRKCMFYGTNPCAALFKGGPP